MLRSVHHVRDRGDPCSPFLFVIIKRRTLFWIAPESSLPLRASKLSCRRMTRRERVLSSGKVSAMISRPSRLRLTIPVDSSILYTLVTAFGHKHSSALFSLIDGISSPRERPRPAKSHRICNSSSILAGALGIGSDLNTLLSFTMFDSPGPVLSTNKMFREVP